MILSCGGGIAELEENRTLLESWKCIWLDAADDVLIARTRGTDRPVLEGLSPEDLMIHLREQRVEKYRSLAGTPIDTSLRSPEDVVLEIIDRMESE
jgi:shikimate kinase